MTDKNNPFNIKSCHDCSNLESALTWWCGDKEAIEYRGTAIPGCIKCPFWKPDWNSIDKKYKTKENGYLSLKEKLKNKWRKLITLPKN